MTTQDQITAVMALPTSDVLASQANQTTAMLIGVVISNDADLQLMVEDLRDAKTKRDTLEERRLAITRPLDQAKAAVMDLFRAPLAAMDAAIAAGKQACLTYTRERDARLRREQAERERAAQAERDRLAAEARRLAAQAAATADAEQADRLRDAADVVKVQAITTVAPIMPAAPKVAGTHTTGGWDVVADDPLAIARHLLATDPEVFGNCFELKLGPLRSLAKLRNGKLEIPGLRVVPKETMVLR